MLPPKLSYSVPFWPLTPDSPSGVKGLGLYLEASGQVQKDPAGDGCIVGE